MTVLWDGYRVPFLDSPPLSRTPVSFPTYRAGFPRAQALQQEVEEMLAKGALKIARDPGPGFYSRLFLVEKASGGWRPVVDLSHLNEFIQLTRFKMETVASVLLSVREGDFLASLDLKDAYFQIPIHPSSRKLLRFTLERTIYQFRALCFGLSTAPQVFTRVFAVVSAWAHSRDQTSTLSGRLVGSLLLGAGSQAGRPVAPLALSYPWDCDKREEVGSRALADCEVSRYDHRYQGWQGFSVSDASREIPDGCGELFYHGRSPSSALAGDPRSPGFARVAGSSRTPSDAHFTVASEGALGPRVRPSLSSGAFATGSETGPVLVDGEGPSVDGGSIRDTCSGSSPVFGRVLFGMGRSPSRSTRVRGVVRPGEVAAHQSSRNEGSFLRPSGIPRRCHRSSRDNDVRQLDGRGVRQQARGHCFPGSMLLRWMESFDIHLYERYLPGQANVLADLLSCRGQVVGTEWSLHPQVARSLLRVWGNPSIDLFATCLSAKLPLYCSLVPDPQAVFEDAFRHPWDDLDLHAFPPFPLVGRVIARVRESSRVAMTLVAPLWPEKEWFADLLLLLTQQSTSAAPLQSLPPRRPCAEPSLVATLQRHFRKSGFSGRAARVLSGCLRSSTSRLYQLRWQIFCGWCRGRGVAPVNATVPVAVDFLIHLRYDKGLSVSVVKGCSSALNSIVALKGRDLASSREIMMLLRSFSRSVDPVELRPPAWDVALVLQSLTEAPYEPLRTCDERFLAQKTLFLLALASAKRIGELHALSYRVSHSRNWGEVSFSFVPGFVA